MPATEPPAQGLRVSDLLGRTVHGVDGGLLGKVADLVLDGTAVVAVVVTTRPWGRLLGYERESAHGPWLLETLAKVVMRRGGREIPWSQVRLRDGHVYLNHGIER